MQAALASRLSPPAGTGSDGSSASPMMPFSVIDASRALPGADGYVFPVKTATIKVASGVPHDAVVQALQAEENVKGVFPNTIMSIVQGEREEGGEEGVQATGRDRKGRP
jgi:hypothetical protein